MTSSRIHRQAHTRSSGVAPLALLSACVWRVDWSCSCRARVWPLGLMLCMRPLACYAVQGTARSAAVWAGCCARACGWAARARCGTTCRATSWPQGMWTAAHGTTRGARSSSLGILASLAGWCMSGTAE